MKTIDIPTVKIGDGPWPVTVSEEIAASLRTTMDDRQIYTLVSRFGPTTRPIAKAKQIAMALENQAKSLPITNPAAWRFRRIHAGNSYEEGYCRHLGKWTSTVEGNTGDSKFTNDLGESPNANNCEFWPG